MLFTAPARQAVPDGHCGYLAGRYRDGAYSDIWTDVSRCAARTFTAYAPACSCGWRGPARPATDIARLAGRRVWIVEHLAGLEPAFREPAHRGPAHRSVACVDLGRAG